MRVDLLGTVAVHGPAGSVAGLALGGRRVRITLVALALAGGPVPAERLAEIVWSGDPPPSWPAALRGVIRALRTSVTPVGLGGQRLVATVPAGYVLATGVTSDVGLARDAVRDAARLLGEGRYRAASDAAAAAGRLDGDALLAGEDLAWLAPLREAVTQTRMRALGVLSAAAGGLGEHAAAVDHARAAVRLSPLDEPAYRSLIHALDSAGDRAGAVHAYEQCRALLADELGVDPSRETVETYLLALHGQAGSPTTRLPVIKTSFRGREAESAELAALLAAPGLVCLTGRGGVGKSRLAAQVGAGFAGTRIWVSLASVTDDELVASAVAIEIGAQVGTGDAATAIRDHLAPLGRVLLVLDGCEAVVDGVASLVTGVLAACPALTVLATGRLPTRIADERVLTVAPLGVPATEDPGTLSGATMVRLLADRVADAGGELRVDARNAPFVAALCRRCGGLPLAIELVAAQLAVTSPQDLLDDLSERAGDGPDGLRDVVRRSLALLDADEAAVFRRFAVLDGPVGLPLIRAVVADDRLAPVRVVRILRELTDRSLLTVDTSGPRWRYAQEDDLHRYAGELLVEAGEREGTLTRLGAAIRSLLPADVRATPAPFRDDVTEVLGSVRSFLSAAVGGLVDREQGLELAFRLHRYWASTDVSEGRFWLSRLLADGDLPARDADGGPPAGTGPGGGGPSAPWGGYARFALGYLSYWSGDAAAAIAQLEPAAVMLHDRDDGFAVRALIYLGGLADDLDRGADAVGFVREAIALSRRLGEVDLRVAAVVGMGSVLAERDDPEAAGYAAQAVELCRRGGSVEQLATMLPTAAMVCWQVGANAATRAYVTEALPMHAGSRRIANVVLQSAAAGLAFADGDAVAAVEFARDADRHGTALGVERELPLLRCVLARALLARGELTGAAAAAVSAVVAARSISYRHPLATCLETVVMVGSASGLAEAAELALLLRCADGIRSRGDRPGVASLRVGLATVREELADALRDLPDAPMSTADATALALDVGRRTGHRQDSAR